MYILLCKRKFCAFLTIRRDNSSSNEERWKGIASIDQRIFFFVSYTEYENRTRIISARLAEPLEKECYYENYKQQITGYER